MKGTGNRGEWSEIYAHFKILEEGFLYPADKNMQRLEESKIPVISVLRYDAPDKEKPKEVTYSVCQNEKLIRIVVGDVAFPDVEQTEFGEQARALFQTLTAGEDNSDTKYAATRSFMERARMFRLKAPSADKSDICLVIHDLHSGRQWRQGYSVKSYIGGKPTLMNASKSTNFHYRLDGWFDPYRIDEFNETKSMERKMEMLWEEECDLQFLCTVHPTFGNNLTYVDSALSKMLAVGLPAMYGKQTKDRSLRAMAEYLAEENPCGFPEEEKLDFYVHKFKQLLIAFALGMTPSKPWKGRYDANGGYIVVREDGEVVCYHFYERNDLEDYLFENAVIDTPSQKRHDFGGIYAIDGEFYLDLNFQIRFK